MTEQTTIAVVTGAASGKGDSVTLGLVAGGWREEIADRVRNLARNPAGCLPGEAVVVSGGL